MPATVKEAMKYGPPRSPKLREQMVSATHNVAPSTYTLHSGEIFTAHRVVRDSVRELCRHELPLLPATRPYVALLPEQDATPLPARQVVRYINIVKRI